MSLWTVTRELLMLVRNGQQSANARSTLSSSQDRKFTDHKKENVQAERKMLEPKSPLELKTKKTLHAARPLPQLPPPTTSRRSCSHAVYFMPSSLRLTYSTPRCQVARHRFSLAVEPTSTHE